MLKENYLQFAREAEKRERSFCKVKLNFDICYTITDSEYEEDVKVYGIKVEMFHEYVCIEKDEITDISSDRAYVTGLAELLQRGAVTPMTLREVLYDYISQS